MKKFVNINGEIEELEIKLYIYELMSSLFKALEDSHIINEILQGKRKASFLQGEDCELRDIEIYLCEIHAVGLGLKELSDMCHSMENYKDTIKRLESLYYLVNALSPEKQEFLF